MALTKAQLYNLAVGDEVIVHGKCEDVYGDEDIRVNTYWTVAGEKREQSFLVHSSYVSLPTEKPKYDPCRKFKKGDKVNVTSRDGRYPVVLPMNYHWVGKNVTVVEDEDDDGCVQVCSEAGDKMSVAFFFLEMVSTVEERMPYGIDPAAANVLLKDGKKFATFEDADKAQEVCDRLNAEWKERDIPET